MSLPRTSLLEAGRALARGEPLRALGWVGRDDSTEGLSLRGIAYAQLGDLELAQTCLERAARGAEDSWTAARARAALAELALSTGDPAPAARLLAASANELGTLGDLRNAMLLRLLAARALVLLGRLEDAQRAVARVLETALPPDLQAVAQLTRAEVAIRAVAPTLAREALSAGRRALEGTPHPLLLRELTALEAELSRPVARLLRAGERLDADLFAIEAASRGEGLLVDACRGIVVRHPVVLPLSRRPVLFALLGVLARAWPASVPRDELAAGAFEVRQVNASHRSRLRVEIGRLRVLLRGLGAQPVATADGYALNSERPVTVLLPPSDEALARVSLLLADGAAWSARGLAEHAGISLRTAQRALSALVETGGAVRTSSGRGARYARPGAPLASRLLLLGLLPQR